MMWKKNRILIFTVLILIIFAVILSKAVTKTTAAPEPIMTAVVKTAAVKSILSGKTLTAYGQVSFAPEYIQQLALQQEIVINKIFVTAGQQVKPGDPLLQFSSSSLARLNLSDAQIAVSFAQQEVSRLTKLKQEYLATNAELQTAQQNLARAQAQLNILLQQQTQTLRATINSTIITINVQPGQVIPSNTTLLSLGDNSKLQARLGVEIDDLATIQVGQPVEIRSLFGNIPPFISQIQHITGQINPIINLIDVIVPLINAPGIVPGSTVRGEISLTPKVNTLAVPHSAVLFEENKPYVFVNVKGIAEKRWITIGDDDGQQVSVLNGLSLGESVVILGNYELENGMALHVEQEP